jgi:hypothetical protein
MIAAVSKRVVILTEAPLLSCESKKRGAAEESIKNRFLDSLELARNDN